MSIADLKDEFAKIDRLTKNQPSNYILMTNRQVSAKSEKTIREKFEEIKNVQKCIVFTETWIEDTIDAHPRLLRLVPRLYGVGDLSQIISFSLQHQTLAVLEDLSNSLRTFVPTDSYRRAEHALNDHGFVVLVGPPASGKSSIAASLCMVAMAQDPDVRILRIERAEQFTDTWSPSDRHTIYWVDDVFGETTLDSVRVHDWSSAFDKVEAARRRKSRVIFCTRDYILASAENLLKKSKLDVIRDARVRVHVDNLTRDEREMIMYNHIKDGDIDKTKKTALKRHLPHLATLRSFTPELARRLGNSRFIRELKMELHDLVSFFNDPVQHFSDIIHGLSGAETAALTVCLANDNSLPHPIQEDDTTRKVGKAYGVTFNGIGDALGNMEGSLVKRVLQSNHQVWMMHHPSMIEALQSDLVAKASKLLLYLQTAKIYSILRDTTANPPPPDSRLVFIPISAYGVLADRLARSDLSDQIVEYLIERASDDLVALIDESYPEFIDTCLDRAFDPDSADITARLAVRLAMHQNHSMFTPDRRNVAEESLVRVFDDVGWCGFLDIAPFRAIMPEIVTRLILQDVEEKFPSISRLYDYYSCDLSTQDLVMVAEQEIKSHVKRLMRFAPPHILEAEDITEINDTADVFFSALREKAEEFVRLEEERASYMEDFWMEQWREERGEMERGRFSDVDE